MTRIKLREVASLPYNITRVFGVLRLCTFDVPADVANRLVADGLAEEDEGKLRMLGDQRGRLPTRDDGGPLVRNSEPDDDELGALGMHRMPDGTLGDAAGKLRTTTLESEATECTLTDDEIEKASGYVITKEKRNGGLVEVRRVGLFDERGRGE